MIIHAHDASKGITVGNISKVSPFKVKSVGFGGDSLTSASISAQSFSEFSRKVKTLT